MFFLEYGIIQGMHDYSVHTLNKPSDSQKQPFKELMSPAGPIPGSTPQRQKTARKQELGSMGMALGPFFQSPATLPVLCTRGRGRWLCSRSSVTLPVASLPCQANSGYRWKGLLPESLCPQVPSGHDNW